MATTDVKELDILGGINQCFEQSRFKNLMMVSGPGSLKLVLIREMSFGGHLGSSFALINISMSKKYMKNINKLTTQIDTAEVNF